VYYKQIYKYKYIKFYVLIISIFAILLAVSSRIAEIEASMVTEDFDVIEQQTDEEKNIKKLYLKLKNKMKVMLLTRNSESSEISVALDIRIGNFYYIYLKICL